MANDVVLPGTGSSVATDEIGGNQFQRMKLTLGADGVNDGDVSSTNPIPVTGGLTDAQLRAADVPVSGDFYPATQPVSIAVPVAVTGPVTDAELRAAPVPVAVSDVTGELIEAIEALRMTIGSLSRTIGMSIPNVAGQQRVSVEAINGGLTLATINTVNSMLTLVNQTQIGGFVAADQIPALMHMSADNLRANIKVT
jgi:hypothetical protein